MSYYTAFVAGTELWTIVRPLKLGSAWRLMQYGEGMGLSESLVGYIMYEVLQAIIYLHSISIIHGGIRASTILIDDDGTVQLSDYRESEHLIQGGQRHQG